MRCSSCGWLVLTKTAPCRVNMAQAVKTRQMMTRALAQAGKPVVLPGAQALLASAILQGVFKKCAR